MLPITFWLWKNESTIFEKYLDEMVIQKYYNGKYREEGRSDLEDLGVLAQNRETDNIP